MEHPPGSGSHAKKKKKRGESIGDWATRNSLFAKWGYLSSKFITPIRTISNFPPFPLIQFENHRISIIYRGLSKMVNNLFSFDATVILRHKIARRHRTFRFILFRTVAVSKFRVATTSIQEEKRKKRRLEDCVSQFPISSTRGGGHLLLLRAGRDYCGWDCLPRCDR